MLFKLATEATNTDLLEETTERNNFIIDYIDNLNWQEIAIVAIIIAIQLVIAFIIFLLVRWIGGKLINRWFAGSRFIKKTSTSRTKTLKRLSFHVFNGILYFLLAFTILEILGVPVGSLLAGAGVIGLALSLGARDFVSDIVNGFVILIEKQVDIGDTVVINDIWGDVIDTNLKTTIVKTFDGAHHYIPNRKIDIISNRSRGSMRALIIIRLFANTDFKKVKQIIKDVTAEKMVDYPGIEGDPEIIIEPTEEGQVTLRVPLFTMPGEEYDTQINFYEAYLTALNNAGIKLPSNTLDIQKQ